MKKYTLAVAGNVEVGSYRTLKVDGVELIEEIAKSCGFNEEKYETKRFAGKVEITITDLTEPLKIDAKECGRTEV